VTKAELIKALDKFDDDYVVVIGDSETGWSNIGELKQDGCCISIMEDMSRPFTSE